MVRFARACRHVSWLMLAAPLFAAAQEAAAPAQKIEVTGSRIPRLLTETALPLQIITREELARTGAQDLEELFERVPAALGGWRESASVSSSDRAGYSGIALHGLGTKSTLVLLNGRRLANHAFSSSGDTGVDLHLIPLAALDRIEVLKDGASAIYGSEAIGGVVNFILRSDYSGWEVNANRGAAEQGGAASWRAGVTFGAGSLERAGWHLFANLSHRRVEALKGAERHFAATAYRPELGLNQLSPASFPANIPRGPGRLLNPAAPNCPARHVLIGTACLFDYAPTVDLVSPLAQTNLVASLRVKLGEAHEARVEWVASSHRLTSSSSPSPVFAAANNQNIPIVLQATSPYYPTGLGLSGNLVNLRYRPLELGVRTGVADADQHRLLAGLRGSLGEWSYDAALSSSRSRATLDYVDGYVAARALIDGPKGLISPAPMPSMRARAAT
jgi:iron complex outermembrane recepter protein